MKNKILINLLLLIGVQLTFSQNKIDNIQLKWSPVFNDHRMNAFKYLGKDTQNNIYFNQKDFTSKSNFTSNLSTKLSKLNKNLLKKDYKVKFDKKTYPIFMLMLNKELHLISTTKDKERQKTFFIDQTINKKSFNVSKQQSKLIEIDFKNDKKYILSDIKHYFSPDSTKLLIKYVFSGKGKEKFYLGLHVFDTNLNKLWGKKIQMPVVKRYFKLLDFKVDNDGKVFVLGKVYKNNRKNDYYRKKKNFYLTVLAYNNGSKMKEYKINGHQNLFDAKLKIGNDSNLIISGLYSKDKSLGADGYFFMKIDTKQQKVLYNKYEKFNLDLLTEGMDEKEKKKTLKLIKKDKFKGLEHQIIKNVVAKPDGGVIIFSEYNHFEESLNFYKYGTFDKNGTKELSFSYGNILILNLDEKGNIIWHKTINKFQYAENLYINEAMSFMVIDRKDKIYIIYNGKGKTHRKKDAITKLKIIDKADGSVDTKVLFKMKDKKVLFIPKFSIKIDKDEYILVNHNKAKKSYRYAKLKFVD